MIQAGLLLLLPSAAGTLPAPADAPVLGAGRHAYRWVPNWIQPPEEELGNTHGVIVEDAAGNLYVNTDTRHAISVYGKDGRFQRSFGAEEGEGVHGMCIVTEGGKEVLYHVNFRLHHWRKRALTGEVLLDVGAPIESGKYESADEFKPTSIAVVPGKKTFVADGYGLSWVHEYDAQGKYVRSFGGPGQMQCCHGLLIDTRKEPNTLLVADRENHRILRYDLDLKLLGEVSGDFRRPCSMQISGPYLAVPDLAGRVTILDEADRLVAHLGDNPDESLRAQNGVPRAKWRDGEFLAPHSAHWDAEGNLYVMDWNSLGRINKLQRVPPEPQPAGVGYEDTPFLTGQGWRVHDKLRPVPPVVVPPAQALPVAPPAGAVVLFDGKDLSRWKSGDKDGAWKVEHGYAEVNGTGSIETKEAFGDCQLHLEFATPEKVEGESQHRGNSGVFLMGMYEIQVLDSFENRTYADGQCAALYGQWPPAANACRKPGEWQSYDITFRAPRFQDGKLVEPARATVVHNGVTVHENREFLGATRHREVATYAPHADKLPLSLQDHGNPVRYRNIWIVRR
jgi:hypothetical protein